MEMIDLLHMAVEWKASDLTLVAGIPPCLRIHGGLIVTDLDPLTTTEVDKLIFSVLDENQKKALKKTKELDFAYSIHGLSRFRINVHYQRGSIGVSVRVIAGNIPSFNELGLPELLSNIARKSKGLILVTGPTGSGKSTTLASVIDRINRERRSHIITIEDPIEFLHDHNMSIVEQREVGSDTHSFYSALRYVLRQDPDIIMVGEMRDLESISMTITAAETGHLVLSTLHTPSAAEAISRIVDVFPSDKQQQIRVQLGSVLEAVVAQHLLPHVSGKGQVLVLEILIGTPAVKNMIRKGEVPQIGTLMEIGSVYGMVTLEKSLKKVYDDKLISHETMSSLLASYKMENK